MSGTHKGYEKPAGAGIVRMPRDAGDETALQRMISATGCTVTEIVQPKTGPKVVRFLYGPGNDPAAAIKILKGQGYNVDVMTRKRP